MPESWSTANQTRIVNLVRETEANLRKGPISFRKAREQLLDLIWLRSEAHRHLSPDQFKVVQAQLDAIGSCLLRTLNQDPWETACLIERMLAGIESKARTRYLRELLDLESTEDHLTKMKEDLYMMKTWYHPHFALLYKLLQGRVDTLLARLEQVRSERQNQVHSFPEKGGQRAGQRKRFFRSYQFPKRKR